MQPATSFALFDVHGQADPFEGEELLRCTTRDQLERTCRVAVASGARKGPSIVGAARAGPIDVLVTDDAAVTAALEQVS